MLALYRKYRPVSFDGVIGQQHITRTLINQIQRDRVGHAYLFTGSRGTGKTTCAKIFARAINCVNPLNGSPCGECDVCKALSNNNNADIFEIDAASNNGVNEIRQIRENVNYPPIYGKYKVYIIDEVHMLSGGAYNALLKTLEEPPSHVIFILATTEVHKLPATILSRCMRFDFHLVPTETIFEHLKEVYNEEGVKYEDDAVRLIAEAGEGSVRDALSLADRCLNYSDFLTYNDVLAVLGASNKQMIRTLFDNIAKGNIGGALEDISQLATLGKSMSLIAKELASYARDMLVLKTSSTQIIVDSKENIEKMKESMGDYSIDTLCQIIIIFSDIDAELRYSVSPKLVLETACIKACKLLNVDIASLTERITRLEKKIASGIVVEQSANHNNIPPQIHETPQMQSHKPMDAFAIWGRVATYFRKNESMKLFSLVAEQEDVEVKDGKFIVWANADNFLLFSDDDCKAEIKKALLDDGVPYELVVDKRKGSVDMDDEISKIKKLIGAAKLNIKK